MNEHVNQLRKREGQDTIEHAALLILLWIALALTVPFYYFVLGDWLAFLFPDKVIATTAIAVTGAWGAVYETINFIRARRRYSLVA